MGFERAAEQLVQRRAQRLAADVPQRHVDAAHGRGRARAHAVAAELPHVDLVPDAHHVVGIHAEHELLERGVDEMCHRARAAAVMRLAPADDASCR